MAAHGVELALRAERDGKALKAAEELVKLGPLDPSHLTRRQEALLEEIARNSMQYAENGQVVIGAWKGLDDGYIQHAMESGSAYYHNHPQVWDILGELGEEQQKQAIWLINQKALQPYIEKGMPFEYTLKGIKEEISTEDQVVKLIWQGKGEAEILKSLPPDSHFATRWRELMELYQAGYQQTFDDIANAYILVKP